MSSLKSLLLAVVAVAPGILSSPVPEAVPRNETVSIQAAPQWYSGPWQNFPNKNTWRSFNDLVGDISAVGGPVPLPWLPRA